MVFWKKETALDKEKKINPGIEDTIKGIISLFTEEQLEILDIVVNEEKFEFLQRMILFYGDAHPLFETEETKKRAQEIINQHKDKLQDHINQDIYEFIKKFDSLFKWKKQRWK